MADREKVIKGLECCWASFPKCKGCPVCPYEKICYHDKACNELLRDALELLKEQQTEIEDMRTAMQSMIEGQCVIAGNKQQPKTGHWKNKSDDPEGLTGLIYCSECGENDVREFDKSRPQWCPMKEQEWIPISERLPENAEHPGAFCPKVRVLTVWGESYGWYNPDMGVWYFLAWYIDYSMRSIDFERGDVPGVSYTPKDTKLITHWKPIP